MKIPSLEKLRRRLRRSWVQTAREYSWYPMLYPAYWHARLVFRKASVASRPNYMAARPNPGAGIGHQVANWIAGLWFARQFHLRFAHIPFTGGTWEQFLGFGAAETTATELRARGYSIVRLPLFDEDKPAEVLNISRMIKSYAGKGVIFLLEQDQFHRDQFGVRDELSQKFWSAHDSECHAPPAPLRLAVHVRRGDIVVASDKSNANLAMRFQDNAYFLKVVREVLNNLGGMPLLIQVFSQGQREDFLDFLELPEVVLCLDQSPQESFLAMASADILITSRSSFSYKPALLSRGVKISPSDFWHGYPKTDDWIVADNDGSVSTDAMKAALENILKRGTEQ